MFFSIHQGFTIDPPQIWERYTITKLTNMGEKYLPILCQEYMLFFCLPLSSQPRLNLLSTQQQGRAPPVWRPDPPRN